MVKSIPEQLTEIYADEPWHNPRMNYEDALVYHTDRYNKGDIYVYRDNGEVLGYYEREIKSNICFLKNVYVKKVYRKGRVFRELCNHFFLTMPSFVEYITGEKQKLSGKWMKERIKYANSLYKSKERNSLAFDLV
jgi:hypothetical protein